jgi:hypothetical protein
LGHAADYSEDFTLARVAFEVLQPIENLLFGFIPNAARVVENVVRRFHGLHLRITLMQERTHDLLGVVCIHLATEGLDVEGLFHFLYCIPRALQ